MHGNVALWIAGAILVGLILLGLAGVLLRLLWNSTIPELFGLRTIRHLASDQAAAHLPAALRRSPRGAPAGSLASLAPRPGS